MSISFEDLQVGQRWQSTGRTLTGADLTIACMTSGDWHPIHADTEFAKQSIGGQRIFHGTYGLHIAMALATKFPDLGSDVVGALGFSEWRFRTPLVIGDTGHVEKWAAKSETGWRFFRATVPNILRRLQPLCQAVLSD